jgi:peptide chain release factor subunit 1
VHTLGGVFDENKNYRFVSEFVVPDIKLKKNVYKCSSTFQLEPLFELAVTQHYEGLLIVTGAETKFYSVSETQEQLLERPTVRLPRNQCRGGQSQARIGRLRDEAIQAYLTSVAERAKRYYTKDGNPCVRSLVIAGNAELKDKLVKFLGPLKNCILLIKTDLKDIKELRPEFQAVFDLDRSEKYVKEFEELMAVGSNKIVYGPTEINKYLELNQIQKVIIHRDFTDLYNDLSIQVINTHSELIRSFGGIVGFLYFAQDID